jgi:hypothetical protein
LLKMQSDSISPDTIHLADGVYSASTGEKFPLSLKAYASISGESRDNTIIDGGNEVWVLNGIMYADHYQISGLTVRNADGQYNAHSYGAIDLIENNHSSFANLLFQGNHGVVCSGGSIHNSNNFSLHNCEFSENIGGQALRLGHADVAVTSDTARVYNCYFNNNKPDYTDPEEGFGGGLSFLGDNKYRGIMNGYVYNCLFTNNVVKDYIWAFDNSLGLIFGCRVNLINCTFGDNIAENPEGANIGVTYNSELNVYNSIMYGSYPAEFYMYNDGDGCSLSISNSLVDGGEEDIRILSPGNIVNYDQSNIDTYPVWDTAGPWPYSLLADSPCIDAGTLDLPPGIELPATDFAGNPRVWGNSIDMGAYEYGPWVKVPDQNDLLPDPKPGLLAANPNPLRDNTVITYWAKQSGHVKITITDIKGILYGTLLDCQTMAQMGQFRWDRTASGNARIPAGTYILRLTINDVLQESLKIVLQ